MVCCSGVAINKEKLNDPELVLSSEDLIDGKYIVAQRGKKKLFSHYSKKLKLSILIYLRSQVLQNLKTFSLSIQRENVILHRNLKGLLE